MKKMRKKSDAVAATYSTDQGEGWVREVRVGVDRGGSE